MLKEGGELKIEPLKIQDGYGIDGTIIPSYHVIIDFLYNSKFSENLVAENTTVEFLQLMRITFPLAYCPAELIPMLYSSDPEYNLTSETANKEEELSNLNYIPPFTSAFIGRDVNNNNASQDQNVQNNENNTKNKKKKVINNTDSLTVPSKRIRSNSELSAKSTSPTTAELIPSVSGILHQHLEEIIMEYGYVFTASQNECETRLKELWHVDTLADSLDSEFAETDSCKVSGKVIAKVIMMMANTLEGLPKSPGSKFNHVLFESENLNGETSPEFYPSTWNVENFLHAIKKFNSKIKMMEVIKHFDSPRFLVKTREQFNLYNLTIEILRRWDNQITKQVHGDESVDQNSNNKVEPVDFPIDFLFSSSWENVENQIIFIETTLNLCVFDEKPIDLGIILALWDLTNSKINPRPKMMLEIIKFYENKKIVAQEENMDDADNSNNNNFDEQSIIQLLLFWNCPQFVDCLIANYDRLISNNDCNKIYNLIVKSIKMIPSAVALALLEAFYARKAFFIGKNNKQTTSGFDFNSVGFKILFTLLNDLILSSKHVDLTEYTQFHPKLVAENYIKKLQVDLVEVTTPNKDLGVSHQNPKKSEKLVDMFPLIVKYLIRYVWQPEEIEGDEDFEGQLNQGRLLIIQIFINLYDEKFTNHYDRGSPSSQGLLAIENLSECWLKISKIHKVITTLAEDLGEAPSNCSSILKIICELALKNCFLNQTFPNPTNISQILAQNTNAKSRNRQKEDILNSAKSSDREKDSHVYKRIKFVFELVTLNNFDLVHNYDTSKILSQDQKLANWSTDMESIIHPLHRKNKNATEANNLHLCKQYLTYFHNKYESVYEFLNEELHNYLTDSFQFRMQWDKMQMAFEGRGPGNNSVNFKNYQTLKAERIPYKDAQYFNYMIYSLIEYLQKRKGFPDHISMNDNIYINYYTKPKNDSKQAKKVAAPPPGMGESKPEQKLSQPPGITANPLGALTGTVKNLFQNFEGKKSASPTSNNNNSNNILDKSMENFDNNLINHFKETKNMLENFRPVGKIDDKFYDLLQNRLYNNNRLIKNTSKLEIYDEKALEILKGKKNENWFQELKEKMKRNPKNYLDNESQESYDGIIFSIFKAICSNTSYEILNDFDRPEDSMTSISKKASLQVENWCNYVATYFKIPHVGEQKLVNENDRNLLLGTKNWILIHLFSMIYEFRIYAGPRNIIDFNFLERLVKAEVGTSLCMAKRRMKFALKIVEKIKEHLDLYPEFSYYLGFIDPFFGRDALTDATLLELSKAFQTQLDLPANLEELQNLVIRSRIPKSSGDSSLTATDSQTHFKGLVNGIRSNNPSGNQDGDFKNNSNNNFIPNNQIGVNSGNGTPNSANPNNNNNNNLNVFNQMVNNINNSAGPNKAQNQSPMMGRSNNPNSMTNSTNSMQNIQNNKKLTAEEEKKNQKDKKKAEKAKKDRVKKKLADLDEFHVEIEDKLDKQVNFMLNNFDRNNYDNSKKKVMDLIQEKHLDWFGWKLANATKETEDFMNLACRLVDELDEDPIYEDRDYLWIEALTNGVIREIKRALLTEENFDPENEKCSSGKSRKDFKLLGQYLGLLTLAKNRPILYDDLDVKSLLHEAYQKGKKALENIITFTCHLMSSVNKSIVFKHPNAWTTSIILVMTEIGNQNKSSHRSNIITFAIETLRHEIGAGEEIRSGIISTEYKYQPPSSRSNNKFEFQVKEYLDNPQRDTENQMCEMPISKKKAKSKNLGKGEGLSSMTGLNSNIRIDLQEETENLLREVSYRLHNMGTYDKDVNQTFKWLRKKLQDSLEGKDGLLRKGFEMRNNRQKSAAKNRQKNANGEVKEYKKNYDLNFINKREINTRVERLISHTSWHLLCSYYQRILRYLELVDEINKFQTNQENPYDRNEYFDDCRKKILNLKDSISTLQKTIRNACASASFFAKKDFEKVLRSMDINDREKGSPNEVILSTIEKYAQYWTRQNLISLCRTNFHEEIAGQLELQVCKNFVEDTLYAYLSGPLLGFNFSPRTQENDSKFKGTLKAIVEFFMKKFQMLYTKFTQSNENVTNRFIQEIVSDWIRKDRVAIEYFQPYIEYGKPNEYGYNDQTREQREKEVLKVMERALQGTIEDYDQVRKGFFDDMLKSNLEIIMRLFYQYYESIAMAKQENNYLLHKMEKFKRNYTCNLPPKTDPNAPIPLELKNKCCHCLLEFASDMRFYSHFNSNIIQYFDNHNYRKSSSLNVFGENEPDKEKRLMALKEVTRDIPNEKEFMKDAQCSMNDFITCIQRAEQGLSGSGAGPFNRSGGGGPPNMMNNGYGNINNNDGMAYDPRMGPYGNNAGHSYGGRGGPMGGRAGDPNNNGAITMDPNQLDAIRREPQGYVSNHYPNISTIEAQYNKIKDDVRMIYQHMDDEHVTIKKLMKLYYSDKDRLYDYYINEISQSPPENHPITRKTIEYYHDDLLSANPQQTGPDGYPIRTRDMPKKYGLYAIYETVRELFMRIRGHLRNSHGKIKDLQEKIHKSSKKHTLTKDAPSMVVPCLVSCLKDVIRSMTKGSEQLFKIHRNCVSFYRNQRQLNPPEEPHLNEQRIRIFLIQTVQYEAIDKMYQVNEWALYAIHCLIQLIVKYNKGTPLDLFSDQMTNWIMEEIVDKLCLKEKGSREEMNDDEYMKFKVNLASAGLGITRQIEDDDRFFIMSQSILMTIENLAFMSQYNKYVQKYTKDDLEMRNYDKDGDLIQLNRIDELLADKMQKLEEEVNYSMNNKSSGSQEKFVIAINFSAMLVMWMTSISVKCNRPFEVAPDGQPIRWKGIQKCREYIDNLCKKYKEDEQMAPELNYASFKFFISSISKIKTLIPDVGKDEQFNESPSARQSNIVVQQNKLKTRRENHNYIRGTNANMSGYPGSNPQGVPPMGRGMDPRAMQGPLAPGSGGPPLSNSGKPYNHDRSEDIYEAAGDNIRKYIRKTMEILQEQHRNPNTDSVENAMNILCNYRDDPQYKDNPDLIWKIFKENDYLSDLLQFLKFFTFCATKCVDHLMKEYQNKFSYFNKSDLHSIMIRNSYNPSEFSGKNISAFVDLIHLILSKHFFSDDTTGREFNRGCKILSMVLGAIGGCLHTKNSQCLKERNNEEFFYKGYFKLFSGIFGKLYNQAKQVGNQKAKKILALYFVHIYYFIRPEKIHLFAYGWIELIGNKTFIEANLENLDLMMPPHQRRNSPDLWKNYFMLLAALFDYLSPLLKVDGLGNPEAKLLYFWGLAKSTQNLIKICDFTCANCKTPLFYDATIRILMFLAIEHSNFLFHFSQALSERIPTNCIQMNHIILHVDPTKNLQKRINPLEIKNIHDAPGILEDPQRRGYGSKDEPPLQDELNKCLKNILRKNEEMNKQAGIWPLSTVRREDEWLYKLDDMIAQLAKLISSSVEREKREIENNSYPNSGPGNKQNPNFVIKNYESLSFVAKELSNQFIREIKESERSPAHEAASSQTRYLICKLEHIQNSSYYAVVSGLMHHFSGYQNHDELKYIFCNIFINNLTYPNVNTWFWHTIVDILFRGDTLLPHYSNEKIVNENQEILAAIIFSRKDAHKPHPWGLTVAYQLIVCQNISMLAKTGREPAFARDDLVKKCVLANYQPPQPRDYQNTMNY